MSGTEKDRPHWVRENEKANWVEEHHRHHRILSNRDCDIDVVATPTTWKQCNHDLTDFQQGNRWYDRVSKEARRTEYWGPERAAVRAQLTRSLDDARAGVDGDASELNEQHRHAPFYGGWWH